LNSNFGVFPRLTIIILLLIWDVRWLVTLSILPIWNLELTLDQIYIVILAINTSSSILRFSSNFTNLFLTLQQFQLCYSCCGFRINTIFARKAETKDCWLLLVGSFVIFLHDYNLTTNVPAIFIVNFGFIAICTNITFRLVRLIVLVNILRSCFLNPCLYISILKRLQS
jgi:hypothetical protein